MNDQFADKDVLLTIKGLKIEGRADESWMQIVNGVDLTLRKGEVLGLIGESGAGKSTLLHIAGLLDTPDAGQVAIGGEDMTGLGDRRRTAVRRADVGFIYQFHHLLPEFTALENIVLPQLANGTAKPVAEARAHELLAQVSIDGRADQRPAALSGGEQQRVALARGFAAKPKLLLADEPTGNLDQETSDAVIDLLFSLTEKYKTTLLLITHDAIIGKRCDREVRIADGQVLNGAVT